MIRSDALPWALLLAGIGWGTALLFTAPGASLFVLASCAGGLAGLAAFRHPGGAAAGAAAGALLQGVPFPADLRLALAAAGVQILLGWAGREVDGASEGAWLRRLLPGTGHLAVATGILVLLVPGGAGFEVALLSYVGGFSVLVLHARWMRRAQAPRDDGWDLPLLGAIILGTLAVTCSFIMATNLFGMGAWPREPFHAVAAACGLLALLALADPPKLPVRQAPVSDALARGIALLAVLNVLAVLFSVVATWSVRVLVVLLTSYVVVAVWMEYRAIRRARLARPVFREPTPSPPEEPVTVLVAAKNEAETLEDSLRENLRLPERFRFLLVPSTFSTDATVEVAWAFEARHPGRVRVLPATSGSKAGDLNQAWARVETPLVLMLDADETVTEESLRWGLAAMASGPDVGIVQGRKVSRTPDASRLHRFVTTERRHATGLDQVMHAELGSTHFAGSAALLRTRVVDDVGGWTERTMTEDIEFTLRLHLESSWRIVYEPRMAVQEGDPASFAALLQQRTRWARGWTQCFGLYFGEVLRKRHALGRTRAMGLAWLLFMSVVTPLMALLPAFLLMRAVGISSLLPYAVGVAIATFVLPARLVGYAYSALCDPHIPIRGDPRALLGTLSHAYAWIFLGWVLGLHALYLELSSAPRVWYVTRKTISPAAPPRLLAARPRGASL